MAMLIRKTWENCDKGQDTMEFYGTLFFKQTPVQTELGSRPGPQITNVL